jgi:protein RecA
MPVSSRPQTLDALLRSGVIKMGNDPSLHYIRIAIGIPQLDTLIGGGVPCGKFILNFGPESAGKTLIAQYIAAAIQRFGKKVLYIDLEGSYDEAWWSQSGVDPALLMVASPASAEETINMIRGVLMSTPDLGMIILDSVAGMIPQVETDPTRGSEESRIPGAQAKAVTFMYHQLKGILGDCIFWSCNQMRDSIGTMSELASLPGGRAQRHYSHIILKTRRESWINNPVNPTQRMGYYMEITSMKNKTCSTADGDAIKLPIMFQNQLDWTTSYIEDGLAYGYIVRRGPYYTFDEQRFMGMQALREFFTSHEDQLARLQYAVENHPR